MEGYEGSELHREDKSEMLQKIAELIAPDQWKEYHENDGVVTNMAGGDIVESLYAAKRVMNGIITSEVLFQHFHGDKK